MPTIQDILDHMSETTNTLNSKGYFNQLKAMKSNAENNLKSNFPVLASKNPTIDDIINSSLNIGGLGVIKGRFRAPTFAEMGQGWDGSKVWWHGSPTKIKPGTERTPFFTTDDPEWIAGEDGWSASAYLSKISPLSKLLDALGKTETTQPYYDILDRAGYKYKRFGGDAILGEHIPGHRLSDPVRGIENLADTVYDKRVQAQLAKEGYSGVRLMDHQGGEETPVEIWTSKPDLLNLGSAKIGNFSDDLETLLEYFKKQTGFR